MRTKHLKTWVQKTPETSCIQNMPQAMNNVENSIGKTFLRNQSLPQSFGKSAAVPLRRTIVYTSITVQQQCMIMRVLEAWKRYGLTRWLFSEVFLDISTLEGEPTTLCRNIPHESTPQYAPTCHQRQYQVRPDVMTRCWRRLESSGTPQSTNGNQLLPWSRLWNVGS